MPKPCVGDKILVDTLKVYKKHYTHNGLRKDKQLDIKKLNIFVEVDGQSFDSEEYDTPEEFLQGIINLSYNVAMGKEQNMTIKDITIDKLNSRIALLEDALQLAQRELKEFYMTDSQSVALTVIKGILRKEK